MGEVPRTMGEVGSLSTERRSVLAAQTLSPPTALRKHHCGGNTAIGQRKLDMSYGSNDESSSCGSWLGTPQKTGDMIVLLASLFVYAFAYHALDASLPFISDEINKSTPASDTEFYGRIKSVFGMLQFFGTLLVGRAGDIIGGKVCLLAAQLSSAANYGLIAAAHSQLGLFLAMIPTLLQQAYQASMMVVANLTDEDTRTKAFGRLTLGYGCGAILGPLVAGYLASTLTERGAVSLSSLMSVAVSVVIAVALPGHSSSSSGQSSGAAYANGKTEPKKMSAGEGFCSILSVSELGRITSLPHIPSFLATVFACNFSRGLLLNLLPQLAKADYSMSPGQVGELLSYNEFVSFVANGLLLGCLLDSGSGGLVSEKTLIVVTMLLCAASLAALYTSHGALALFSSMVPIVGSNIVNTVITSMATKRVPQADTGGVIGLNMGSMTLSNVVTPLLGARLYAAGGLPAVCAAAGCGMFLSAGLASAVLPAAGGEYTRLDDKKGAAGIQAYRNDSQISGQV